jgi:hypothetical protein
MVQQLTQRRVIEKKKKKDDEVEVKEEVSKTTCNDANSRSSIKKEIPIYLQKSISNSIRGAVLRRSNSNIVNHLQKYIISNSIQFSVEVSKCNVRLLLLEICDY